MPFLQVYKGLRPAETGRGQSCPDHRPKGKQTMFSKIYAAAAARKAQPAGGRVYMLRDARTHKEIARGSLEKMRDLQAAFGVSYVAAA